MKGGEKVKKKEKPVTYSLLFQGQKELLAPWGTAETPLLSLQPYFTLVIFFLNHIFLT